MLEALVLVGIVAFLLFVGLHYFPWPRLIGHVLGPPWNYVAGQLGLGACYTTLFGYWWYTGKVVPAAIGLLAFWIVVCSGGGAVLVCYALDFYLEGKAELEDERDLRQLGESRDERQAS